MARPEYILKSFILRAKYYHDQIKEDKKKRVWKLFEMHTKFLTKSLKGDHLKDLTIDGRAILKLMLRK